MRWVNQGAVADTVYCLPELHYPDYVNAAELLICNLATMGKESLPVIIDDLGEWSRAEVVEMVRSWAETFRRHGLEPGDRVLFHLEDRCDLVGSVLGAILAGGVAVPTYHQLESSALVYRIEDCRPTMVVTTKSLEDKFDSLGSSHPGLTVLFVDEGTRSVVHTAPRQKQNWDDSLSPDDLALILYTSGTTGRPKGTCHTHRDLLAVCDTYARYCLRLTEKDVIASPAPVPFALGFGLFVLFPFRFGCAVVLTRDKNPDKFLTLVERYGANLIFGVPTYYSLLLDALERRGERHPFPPACAYFCGGEPLLTSLADDWRQRTGCPLSQFLGTTEMLHCFLGFQRDQDIDEPMSIGEPVHGYEVAVLDPQTKRIAERGSVGLLAVRGPTATKYWQRPDSQDDVVIGGWNVVQDLVRMDNRGRVFFVDRNDNMILSGGMRISPAEVEHALQAHPAVQDCLCVPGRDPEGKRSSVVTAFVVTTPGTEEHDGLKKELEQFVRTRAPSYMRPRRIEFLSALPKSTSGKLERSVLRNRAQGLSDDVV